MELDELVKKTVKQVINEIAGANDNAINTINEIVEQINHDLQYGGVLKDKYIVNAPYGGTLNVAIVDDYVMNAVKGTKVTAYYNHTARTVYIRRSRIGCDGWRLMVKSDLIHEFTHNIQMSQEPYDLLKRRKRYYLNYKPTTDLGKNISYMFDDDEMYSRISEAYYEFSEAIRDNDDNTIRSDEFKEFVFNRTWALSNILNMKLLVYKVINIEPDEQNLKQLMDIGLSINNKSHDKSNKRETNICISSEKQAVIQSKIDEIKYEKNFIKKIINSIMQKRRQLTKEHNKQQKLIDNEIKQLKNMIIKIMNDKLNDYTNKINKTWEYLVSDYISNGGHFSLETSKKHLN